MKAQVITDHKTDIFVAGLKAAGYEIVPSNPFPKPDDVLVAWNRKSSNIDRIKAYEAAGARVIIAENGYIGTDQKGGRLIALALNYHLGAGRWYVGEEPRHTEHSFLIHPWRSGGEELVILAQRGIGNSKTLDWAEELRRSIKTKTQRPVRVRAHPGKNPEPLEPDLLRAHAVITWSSAAAIRAIAFGVPAFYLMPDWIGELAAIFGAEDFENPFMGDRMPMFHRLGWAQWTAEEVISGEAIKYLQRVK